MEKNERRMEQKIFREIETLLQRLNDEDKTFCAENIILQAVIWGSNNGYEGLGLLENSKREWVKLVEENVE
jgi:hypothetical protein